MNKAKSPLSSKSPVSVLYNDTNGIDSPFDQPSIFFFLSNTTYNFYSAIHAERTQRLIYIHVYISGKFTSIVHTHAITYQYILHTRACNRVYPCTCVCVRRACVRACVRVCVCVRARAHVCEYDKMRASVELCKHSSFLRNSMYH